MSWTEQGDAVYGRYERLRGTPRGLPQVGPFTQSSTSTVLNGEALRMFNASFRYCDKIIREAPGRYAVEPCGCASLIYPIQYIDAADSAGYGLPTGVFEIDYSPDVSSYQMHDICVDGNINGVTWSYEQLTCDPSVPSTTVATVEADFDVTYKDPHVLQLPDGT